MTRRVSPAARRVGAARRGFGVALAALVVTIALEVPQAEAQLAAPNAAGVSMGHLHYRVRDVPAHVRFWTALGGRALTIDGTQVVAFPDVLVFLAQGATQGVAPGGTEGSVVNHVAFRVPVLAAVEAAGLVVARLKQFPGVASVTTPEGERIELFENAATNLTFTRDALSQGDAGGPVAGVAAARVAADVALSDRHNRPLQQPIAFHHVHLYVPDGQVADAKVWYARMFGGIPGKRSNYDAVDLPGININISAAPRPTVPTEGRMLDHVGFEVVGLEAFAKALQAKGVALVVPYTRPTSGRAPYAMVVDPWGTSIELTEGLREAQQIVPLPAAPTPAAPAPPPPPPPPPAARWVPSSPVLRLDAALDALVPPGATIDQVATAFGFVEGPVWSRDGALVFSDIPGNTIFKLASGSDAGGPVAVLRRPSGYTGSESRAPGSHIGSNGLTIDRQGRLIVAEHGDRRVSRIETDGRVTILADRYDGKRLNSPNDVVVKSDGAIYFTDPPYGLPRQDQDPAKELPHSGIYRIKDGKVELLSAALNRPNGLAFSPDERTLYVANSENTRKIWMRFDVKADGTLSEGRVFLDVTADPAPGIPDGLKVDRAGNLFGTGPGGVWIISPQGKALGRIQPPELPANVAWGEDGKTLYMTARSSVYRVRLLATGPRPAVD